MRANHRGAYRRPLSHRREGRRNERWVSGVVWGLGAFRDLVTMEFVECARLASAMPGTVFAGIKCQCACLSVLVQGFQVDGAST